VLNLSSNELKKFPSWIASMIKLKHFDFSNNPISEESWENLRYYFNVLHLKKVFYDELFGRLLGKNCRSLRWIK
jgi:Leucine-rich repeat (LRR) protein